LVLSLVAGLAGCTVGPKYVHPTTPVHDEWSPKGDTRVVTQTGADSAWWRVFNDTTLEHLIEMAYQQDLTLQIAGVRIMQSRAQLGLAVGRQYPQFQAVFASVNAIGVSENAANTGPLAAAGLLDRNYFDYQVGFDAFWEADFWGKFKQGVKAGAADYLASVADYDNALVSLTAEVARTYAVIRTFEVLIDQARQNASLQEEGLRIATSRYRNGATSELDVAQASTLLESTRATIPQMQISLTQAENALTTLLGLPTGVLGQLLQTPKGIPTVPATVAIGVPAEMLRRRPDVRSAEFNAIAQSARVGVAVADLYPSFSLAGLLGFSTASGASNAGGGLFNAGSFFYQIGPRLLYPLFNYGRIHNNIRIEDARLQQSLIGYQSAVLKAAQEVEDGLAGFLNSQDAATYSQNAVNGAQRSVQLAFVQYREGAVDFQRVLDAQRSLLQQQNELAQTRSAIATSLIAVYKALGGGWELREGHPFVPDTVRSQMEHRVNWGDLFTETPAQGTVNSLSTTPDSAKSSAPPR
jgi:NodT family efflux transporter outer membrane factor (OMF) lipoprotein